jgi:predicted RNA-binding protein with RPS1 domain
LREGQEVPTYFQLTTKPVQIKYLPIDESKGGMESSISTKDRAQQTIIHQAGPQKKSFRPIPRHGKYLVFTTKIGKFPGTIEKKLPGLKAGSKFNAEIRYDGHLYIGEYERRK